MPQSQVLSKNIKVRKILRKQTQQKKSQVLSRWGVKEEKKKKKKDKEGAPVGKTAEEIEREAAEVL